MERVKAQEVDWVEAALDGALEALECRIDLPKRGVNDGSKKTRVVIRACCGKQILERDAGAMAVAHLGLNPAGEGDHLQIPRGALSRLAQRLQGFGRAAHRPQPLTQKEVGAVIRGIQPNGF